jgi:orotate phosphoribosyltransferase
MSDNKIIQEFESAGAILKGHFILSSGLHSDTYLQCARALMNPKRAEFLCGQLADKVRKSEIGQIDVVVAPAMGGVIVGYELARQLGVPSLFCERVEGKFELRRGFALEKNSRVLIVEDVVTTGKSSLETVKCIEENGGAVVGEASLINRSGEEQPLGKITLVSLMQINIATYKPDSLPPHLAEVPAIKPGSRWLKS